MMKSMLANRFFLQTIIVAATLIGAASCEIDVAGSTDTDIEPKNLPEGYTFTISGGSEGSDTRALLDSDGIYYWQPDDKVGLSIAEAGSTTPLFADNLILTSDQTEAKSTHTTFSGNLLKVQIDAFSSEKTYDYYSYFPKEVGTIGSLSNFSFTIPSTLTVTPGVFNPLYAPMAAVMTGQRPIVYLNGEDLECSNDLVHFNYKHILSYAAIEMDVKLMDSTVSTITLTNNAGRAICGNYSYNMSTGTVSITGGSSSIKIEIAGGLNPGDGKVLYIPMPPMDMLDDQFTVSFTTSSTNKYENVADVKGVKFEKGYIHHLRVAPVVKYTADETFTVTKSGYYFIEAWGGNGGKGGNGSGNAYDAPGGSNGKGEYTSGLYYFKVEDELRVQIGTAGKNGTDNAYVISGTFRTGGAAGPAGTAKWFGNGYSGGNGGTGTPAHVGGGGGGGGGAASGVLKNGTQVSNIVLASGGGGGGGGGGISSAGGNGGDCNAVGSNGGAKGGDSWSTTLTDGIVYPNGARHNGQSGNVLSFAYRGGGGAGGGGGGWNSTNNGGGGYSGVGGARGGNSDSGGGGGGAGGKSSSVSTVSNDRGFTLPTNVRPYNWTDGFVVITFFRE